MTSTVGLAIKGDLKEYARDFEKALARADTKAVRAAAGAFRGHVNRQIARNFKGSLRLKKSLFKRNDPKTGYSLNPSSTIEPKAVYRQGTSGRAADVDLIDLYTTSEVVTAHGHNWLAVPTAEAPLRAGRGGVRHATPKESGLKMTFLRTADPNKAVLVVRHHRQRRGIVVYVLLKMTTRAKRIDTDAALAYAAPKITALFDKNWAEETATLDSKYGRSS